MSGCELSLVGRHRLVRVSQPVSGSCIARVKNKGLEEGCLVCSSCENSEGPPMFVPTHTGFIDGSLNVEPDLISMDVNNMMWTTLVALSRDGTCANLRKQCARGCLRLLLADAFLASCTGHPSR